MSKDKAEEKARAYAKDCSICPTLESQDEIDNSHREEIERAYLAGYNSLSIENAQLREALREIVDQIDEIGINRAVDYANGSRYYRCMISDESYEKAKQLLTDKE